jgi:hypothetical protein
MVMSALWLGEFEGSSYAFCHVIFDHNYKTELTHSNHPSIYEFTEELFSLLLFQNEPV